MSAKKKTPRKRQGEDDASLRAMYAEFREENAKELAREGIGNW